MKKRALEGVKVLEFAYIGVTPSTVKALAANGAEVVRVESTTRLDPLRTSGPYVDGVKSPEHSAEILSTHTDKYGITLNLKHPKGVEIARKLAAWADIVADGWTTGALDRLGLGYEDLKKINPDIIMFSSNTFGQTGPLASFASTGIQLTGMTGFTEVSGWQDRPPVALGYYSDFIVPHFNLVSVLAALNYKQRTGKGQHLDLAQCEAAIYFNAPLVMDYTANKRLGKRHGNRAPNAAPHGVYRCQGEDRWCAISVFTSKEWQSFCKVIGNPPWTKDPKFTSIVSRKKNEDELDKLVEAWTINHSAKEVMTLMQSAGVAAGAVQDGEEVFKDPHFNAAGYYRSMFYPGIGREFPTMLPFAEMSRTPAEIRKPSPMMGEHNEYVYTKLIGMSDEEFAQAMAEGVFE